MAHQGLAPKYLKAIREIKGECIKSPETFHDRLVELSITGKHVVKTVTEAALLGHLIKQGMPEGMVILSDDAGQFNILSHALC